MDSAAPGSRQRFGILLLALGTTFFFEGVAQPGDVQRAIGTVLVGTTLMLALYAAEFSMRLLRNAGALILVAVIAVVVASLADKSNAVAGIAAIVNGLMIAFAPVAVITGVLRHLRETGSVTVTTVAGVLCLYLLIGLFFAFSTRRSRASAGLRSSQMVRPPRQHAPFTSAL
jgi:hypothetical protein